MPIGFAIPAFGTVQVRKLHERVNGQLGESVGPFRKGHSYDANHLPTMVWVHATLIDTAVMMYRAFVGEFSPSELDSIIRESFVHRKLFGIPDSVPPAMSWKCFAAYCHRMGTSK